MNGTNWPAVRRVRKHLPDTTDPANRLGTLIALTATETGVRVASDPSAIKQTAPAMAAALRRAAMQLEAIK